MPRIQAQRTPHPAARPHANAYVSRFPAGPPGDSAKHRRAHRYRRRRHQYAADQVLPRASMPEATKPSAIPEYSITSPAGCVEYFAQALPCTRSGRRRAESACAPRTPRMSLRVRAYPCKAVPPRFMYSPCHKNRRPEFGLVPRAVRAEPARALDCATGTDDARRYARGSSCR